MSPDRAAFNNDTTEGVAYRSARTDSLDHDEVVSHFVDIVLVPKGGPHRERQSLTMYL